MKAKAFTIVEFLVVIAVIAVLAALLFPAFVQAKREGQKASALSNARQLGAAHALYMADTDDRYAPYFSGYEPRTGTYHDPQRYWPDLITPYLGGGRPGRGHLGQSLAEDLPSGFFDPVKPCPPMATTGDDLGIVAGWGVSDEMTDWYGTKGEPGTKVGRTLSEFSSPAATLHLVETWDWMYHRFAGSVMALTPYVRQIGLAKGRTSKDVIDLPHGGGRPRDEQNAKLPLLGRGIAIWGDGHSSASPVSVLLDASSWRRSS